MAIALLVRCIDMEVSASLTPGGFPCIVLLAIWGLIGGQAVVECTSVTVSREMVVPSWVAVALPTTHLKDEMHGLHVHGHPISRCYRFRTCVKIHVNGVSMAHLDVKV